MVNLKKWFVCILFCLPMFVTALSVTPAKASTLDERVGVLAVDTALSSFVDVLPPAETVEELGGVRGWLADIGHKFKQAWENDNRNWQTFIENASSLVSDVFSDNINVASDIVKDVREVIVSAYDFIFGVEISGENYDTSGLGSGWNQFLEIGLSSGENAFVLIREYDDYRGLYFVSRLSSVVQNIGFNGNDIATPTGFWYPYNTSPFFDYPNYSSFTCFYVGEVPLITGNRADRVSINFIRYGVPAESIEFKPTVDERYFNKYYFGFGNNSNISPSRIVNNYETIYNYVTNNFYTDAVREIKEYPKEYYVSPAWPSRNGVSINGIGGITINLPNADGFGNLFGGTDTSEVFAVENSNWLSVLNILPQPVLIMFFIAIAVGCTCVVIKAVK